MKIEQDYAEIVSGVRHGFTIGSPISMLIWNKDWENWIPARQFLFIAQVVGGVLQLQIH